jgi:hypothetical protein
MKEAVHQFGGFFNVPGQKAARPENGQALRKQSQGYMVL